MVLMEIGLNIFFCIKCKKIQVLDYEEGAKIKCQYCGSDIVIYLREQEEFNPSRRYS